MAGGAALTRPRCSPLAFQRGDVITWFPLGLRRLPMVSLAGPIARERCGQSTIHPSPPGSPPRAIVSSAWTSVVASCLPALPLSLQRYHRVGARRLNSRPGQEGPGSARLALTDQSVLICTCRQSRLRRHERFAREEGDRSVCCPARTRHHRSFRGSPVSIACPRRQCHPHDNKSATIPSGRNRNGSPRLS